MTTTSSAPSVHHSRMLDVLDAVAALGVAVEQMAALDPAAAPPDLADGWSTLVEDAQGAVWASGGVRRFARSLLPLGLLAEREALRERGAARVGYVVTLAGVRRPGGDIDHTAREEACGRLADALPGAVLLDPTGLHDRRLPARVGETVAVLAAVRPEAEAALDDCAAVESYGEAAEADDASGVCYDGPDTVVRLARV